MSEKQPPKLYTTKELAEIFQKNEETIRRWIKSGFLPATKIGGSYYVEENALNRILRGDTKPEDR